MESGWHLAGKNQVFGRASRYKSHETSPPQKRVVDIYNLYLLKFWEYDYIKNLEGARDNIDEIIDVTEDGENLSLYDIYNNERLYGPRLKLSIDLALRNRSISKQKLIDKFLGILKKISIESKHCEVKLGKN